MKKEEWYKNHSVCPKCGSIKIKKSATNVVCSNEDDFSDEVNSAKCEACGWKGMVKMLAPDTKQSVDERIKEAEEMKVMLRTVSIPNDLGYYDVFVSVEDCVATIRQFGQRLINASISDEQIEYTEKVMTEILKIFISTEMNHRINKERETIAGSSETEIKEE